MAPLPAQDCAGSSLLSLSTSTPAFSECELAALKAGLALRGNCTGGVAVRGGPPAGGPHLLKSDANASTADPSSRGFEDTPESAVLLRASAEEETDCRFAFKPRRYKQQFASLYFTRLQQLRPHLIEAAKAHWPTISVLDAIKDARPQEECVVIGTLFKEMPLRPSILSEYMNTLEVQTPVTPQESKEPRLFLEDMSARISLTPEASSVAPAFLAEADGRFRCYGSLDIHRCVTGMVSAVRGVALRTGIFSVKEICIAGLAATGEQFEAPSRIEKMAIDGFNLSSKYVAFISGLRLGSECVRPKALQLLRDFLLGAAPTSSLRRLASQIVKVVVCGDCLSLPGALTSSTNSSSSFDSSASLAAALREGDTYYAQLASSVSVALMPGPSDPTTFALPQRPLHAALLPMTRQYDSARGATNPHAFVVDGIRFVGSSGQPVKDICACSSLSPLEALQLTAYCRCLAPTAPDSLSCYPFVNDDPFCISGAKSYHVYFAGLQQQHQCCRLTAAPAAAAETAAETAAAVAVCIPDFSLQGEIVLLSLDTLESKTLRFSEA